MTLLFYIALMRKVEFLKKLLRKRGIPYKIYGGLSFYQRKEIKDVISYFRLVVKS